MEWQIIVLDYGNMILLSFVVEGSIESSTEVGAVEIRTGLNVIVQSQVLELSVLPELDFTTLLLQNAVHCLWKSISQGRFYVLFNVCCNSPSENWHEKFNEISHEAASHIELENITIDSKVSRDNLEGTNLLFASHLCSQS